MQIRVSVRSLLVLVLACFPIGLIFAPFLLSLSMLLTVLIALIRIDLLPLQIRFRPDREQWRAFRAAPHFWSLMGLFLLVFWGSWEAQDMGYWLSRLRIKLPFLLLPPAFFFLPRLSQRTMDGLLYYLVVLLSLTSLGVLVHYLQDMEAINQLIKQGKSIPLPANHVRFSLLLVLGVLSALYLYFRAYFWRKPWERYLQLGMAAFLFVFLHILSVRTGMAVLYATLFLLAVRFMLKTRRYWLGLGLLLGMLIFPVLAYQAMPSLRAKVDYVRYDLFMYRHGHADTALSDAGRWVSLQLGWEVFREHPWLGVGVGNLKEVIHQRYADRYPEVTIEMRRMPHNQFLSMLAATGFLGTTLFGLLFFYPLFYARNYQHWLLLGLYGIISLSLLVENTLENAMGVGLFLYYALHLLLRFSAAPDVASGVDGR